MTRGVDKLVAAAGGRRLLAARLGVTKQAVAGWVQRGYIPASRAVEAEAQYGVDRRELVDPRLVGLLS